MNPPPAPSPFATLEVRLRRVTVVLGLAVLVTLAVVAFAWFRLAHLDNLRLRTLSIVDEHGVERVRIAGQLPDAVVNGNRVPRGDQAAGVIIYDDAGQERGGYITFSRSRSAALTLDTRKGMVVLLAADSTGGAALRLWGADFSDWLDFRADSAGARFSVGRRNEIVLQQPTMSEHQAAAMCSELKSELRQATVRPPIQEVLRACKQQMSDTACRKCLQIR